MAWERVVGQAAIIRILQRSVLSDRIPQALLLEGAEGCGTLALATAYARVVLCEQRTTGANGTDACGVCRSCVQNAQLRHPNLQLITALPSGKADSEADLPADVLEELSELITSVANDPYQPFILPGAATIRISQIRELKRSLALSAVQQGYRVVILHRAETLTTEAANAFLKTLEEPHPNTLLILTAAQPDRLLTTITSRCQRLFVPPISTHDVVGELIKRGSSETDAMLAASVAQGNFLHAVQVATDDLREVFEETLTLLRASLHGREYRMRVTSAIESMLDRRDKQKAVSICSVLALWFKDIQTLMADGEPNSAFTYFDPQALVKFVTSFPSVNMQKVISEIEKASFDISRNVQIHLVMLSLMLCIRDCCLRPNIPREHGPA